MTLSLPTLEQMETAMNQEIENLGGIELAELACDRMYSATFRSEVMRLDDVECWDEIVDDLKHALLYATYSKSTGAKPMDQIDCEYEYEALVDDADRWFKENRKPIIITGNTLVIETCNYKGEGEGIELYCFHENTPVFKSKTESFNQANQFNNTQG